MPSVPRRFASVLLSLTLLAGAPAAASAQWIFGGAGGTFPSGDYGDYANTGWMLTAGYGHDVSPNIALGVEGFYGSNSHEDFEVVLAVAPTLNLSTARAEGDKTNLYGAHVFGQYSFSPGAQLSPYVLAGVGLLVHKFASDVFEESSESALAFNLGAGLAYAVGPTWGLYGEGRYMSASFDEGTTAFLGLFAGAFVRLRP